MMTAAHIAKGLGHSKIRVNYLFSELMSESLFEEDPLPDIAIKKKDKNELIQKYLDGIDFESSPHFLEEAHNLHPESKRKGLERADKMIQHFSNLYKNSDKKVAHIAITHGYFVNKFALKLNGRIAVSEYCSISGATIKGDNATLILDSYVDHILTW